MMYSCALHSGREKIVNDGYGEQNGCWVPRVKLRPLLVLVYFFPSPPARKTGYYLYGFCVSFCRKQNKRKDFSLLERTSCTPSSESGS